MISYFVEHKQGKPISISATRISADAIEIDEALAAEFYAARELLDKWIVIAGVLYRDDLGINKPTGEVNTLSYTNTLPHKPSFVIVPLVAKNKINLYFPIEHEADLLGKSLKMFVDTNIFEIKFDAFDNGYLQLHAEQATTSVYRIDDTLRNVVLMRDYHPAHLRKAKNKAIRFPASGGYCLVPDHLVGSTIYLVNKYNPNKIIDKIIATKKLRLDNRYRMVIDGHTIESS